MWGLTHYFKGTGTLQSRALFKFQVGYGGIPLDRRRLSPFLKGTGTFVESTRPLPESEIRCMEHGFSGSC